ncbi:radial spoke head 1 homolog [Cyclospora cayetanensis]|uniref:Radial spoke head 1 homolog n=1 Tax=Cyclospora cayetanensis TaxID=88456 RepID=A0A6P6RU10_9EIME|nr:radial spoke head 1 homolog [Cyclospora cayetanensis]
MANEALDKSAIYVSFTTDSGSPVESPRKFSGRGRAVYADGSTFEGELVEGRREGYGTYAFPNGDKYEGLYKNGKRHGKGRLTFSDGGFFHGEFLCGQREGMGVRRFANGDFYFGEWKKGLYNGQGTYTFGQNKQKLKGEWVAGQLVRGDWIWRDKTSYSGTFCDSKPQGEGLWRFPTGTEVAGVYSQRVIPTDTRAAGAAKGEDEPLGAPLVKSQQVLLSWQTENPQYTGGGLLGLARSADAKQPAVSTADSFQTLRHSAPHAPLFRPPEIAASPLARNAVKGSLRGECISEETPAF